jgi:rRNA maturation endonuclease Nob1
MTNLGTQFVLAARRVILVEETEPVIHAAQSAFMKFCSVCFEIMPHVRKEDHSECTVCGLKTFPKSHVNESEPGR